MKQRNEAIVGISLGTKQTGVAVISYGTLIHWQTHQFIGPWSDAKLSTVIGRFETYLKKYGIKRVFIKIPPFTHHNDAITALLKQLLQRCQFHDCIVEYATKSRIKRTIPEVKNDETMIEYVVNRYPILRPEREKALHQTDGYHTKMFEAVLAAHLMHEKLMCRR
jgi:hypothetical protein